MGAGYVSATSEVVVVSADRALALPSTRPRRALRNNILKMLHLRRFCSTLAQHTHVVDELGLVPQELLERAKAELDRHVLRVVGLEEDGQAADSLRAAGRRGAATCGAHARKTRVEGGTSRGLV